MKKTGIIISMILLSFMVKSQSTLNLTGKIFVQNDEIPNSTTELHFQSSTKVLYVMTNYVLGKTYIDKCIGNAKIKGNNISINCLCDDKELFPDPIKENFIYDPKTKQLTSTKYVPNIVWNLKQ